MASSVLKKENVIESEMVEMESRENYAKVKFVGSGKVWDWVKKFVGLGYM